MDHGGKVAILAQDLFEEPFAGDAFRLENGLHAPAGIHQHGDGQG
jgi:hypothetical protein